MTKRKSQNKKDGQVSELPFTAERERLACSFERIYFSRGTDRDIYLERKKLGERSEEHTSELQSPC